MTEIQQWVISKLKDDCLSSGSFIELPPEGLQIEMGSGGGEWDTHQGGGKWLKNDVQSRPGVDMVFDAVNPPLGDETVRWIRARGFIEHLCFKVVGVALRQWRRILKKGGMVDFDFPSVLAWACRLALGVVSEKAYLRAIYGWQHWADAWMAKDGKMSWEDTEAYKDPYPHIHKSGWTCRSMADLLAEIGYAYDMQWNRLAFGHPPKDPYFVATEENVYCSHVAGGFQVQVRCQKQ